MASGRLGGASGSVDGLRGGRHYGSGRAQANAVPVVENEQAPGERADPGKGNRGVTDQDRSSTDDPSMIPSPATEPGFNAQRKPMELRQRHDRVPDAGPSPSGNRRPRRRTDPRRHSRRWPASRPLTASWLRRFRVTAKASYAPTVSPAANRVPGVYDAAPGWGSKKETEYGLGVYDAGGSPADRGGVLEGMCRALPELFPTLPGASGGYFTGNGARFYIDCGHPEYCTPEVDNPRDVVLYMLAGDAMWRAAADWVLARSPEF